MQRNVTGRYPSLEAADEALHNLIATGLPASAVTIREPVRRAGAFDHLARALAPHKAADISGESYQLSADVPPERMDQALLILGRSATSGVPALGPREQLFEFPEVREEMRVGKQQFVREEVVLRKEVREKVADIHATLRSTEVEVEEIKPEPERPPAQALPVDAAPKPEEPLRFGLRSRPK